ncbi:MAG TPA: spore maturation protein [Acidobacteria bacterium]|nr:spore maturation protein [Acidobacteriota bacterium]
MLNGLIVSVALASILLAAFSGQMQALTDSILSSARNAVDLAIGLVGVMAFFLGLFRIAEDAGLLRHLARLVGPMLHRLFPSVPVGSPAMSAMILNISSNMLGLGNAATPFGIKAMEELDKLNSKPGTATNAMVMFLAINTSALAILPSGAVGMRASVGSEDAMGIFIPTWFASGCATLVGITAAVLLSRLWIYRSTEPAALPAADTGNMADAADYAPLAFDAPEALAPKPVRRWLGRLFWLGLAGLLARFVWDGRTESTADIITDVTSAWMLPTLVATLVLYGWVRGVRVYDSLVEGAKQGFQVAIRIIPYLVAILVVVGMFRASGGIDLIVVVLSPFTAIIGLPAEALPMALLRPLTGTGAFGVMTETMQVYGADSVVGYMVSTFQGSTETTFYTLAVYYGAVGIRETRHTVPACLLADTAGILGAVFIVNLMFG